MQGNSRNTNWIGDMLTGFFAFLLAVPLFFLAYRQLPVMGVPLYIDRILLFIIIIALLLLVLRLFKTLLTIIFLAVLVWLGYGSFTDGYGYAEVYKDAQAFIYTFQNDPNVRKFIWADSTSKKETIPHEKELLAAMDFDNSIVRIFAVAATNEYFREAQQVNTAYRNIIQCFSVFKKINANWNYVDDPNGEEYFAKASESVKLLAGDCDDHAILMASAIKAIGGRPRLVHTTLHIYPELFIGNKNDLERINFLIKEQLFAQESKNQELNYHEDAAGIWLNLDYTRHYPGGDFMAEPVLGVLYP